ncbi:MAG: hypothetical protein JNJ56_13405 [Ignavibacteria bacterium]|nr:hypothetical protein [Ignavibacteria bacterium]
MYKSSLFETLKSFSKQEIKEFGLLINSPFFNTNQSVVKLFSRIAILYPEFDENKSDKRLLFTKAFGTTAYDDSFMRMTVFRLFELAKEFLIYKNLQRNSLNKETLLLDELNSRELNDLMMKSISKLEKNIEKQKNKEAWTYFARYRLEYFKNEVKSRDTKMITHKDTLGKDLMLEQKNLNTFYFINSLKFFQYFLNQKNFVVNAKGNPDFMMIILDYLKVNSGYLSVPVLKVYFYMTLMLITGDDKYFFELKRILFEDRSDISYYEKFNLIATLRNYAQQKYNDGDVNFKSSVIDILKFSIAKNLLTAAEGGKYISEMRFMNIIWAGIQSEDLVWTEEFIREFIHKTEPDKRQYILAYGIACLEFEKGNYSAALEILSKSGSIKNVYFKAAIKQLTLMIYYELHWHVQATDLLDAYRHFINADKLLPEIYITRCNSFINCYNSLLRLNDNKGNCSFELSELITELNSTSQKWLLKKALELEMKMSDS